MRLIVCLDDKNGMLFGGKRQSRDRVLCERILTLTDGSRLWMNGYSSELFAEWADKICVDECFLDHAQDSDFCFVENKNVFFYEMQIGEIVLFKWNRHYPADTYFPLNTSAQPWKLTHTEEFQGYSHGKITMEVYTR